MRATGSPVEPSIQASGQTIESMGDKLALLMGAVTVASVSGGAGALLVIFLAGLSLLLSLVLTLVAAVRSRRPSPFTIRALKAIIAQVCCCALFCFAWKLLVR